jgi:hypothetical protein
MKLQKALNEQLFESSVTDQDYQQQQHSTETAADATQEEWSKYFDHASGAHYWLHHATGHTEWEEDGGVDYNNEDGGQHDEQYYETTANSSRSRGNEREAKEIADFNQQQQQKNKKTNDSKQKKVEKSEENFKQDDDDDELIESSRRLNLDTSPVRVDENKVPISDKKKKKELSNDDDDEVIKTSPLQTKQDEMKRISSSQGLKNIHTDLDYDIQPKSNIVKSPKKKRNNEEDDEIILKKEKDAQMKRMATVSGLSNLHSDLDYDSPPPKAASTNNVLNRSGSRGGLLSPKAKAGRVPVPSPTPKNNANSKSSPKIVGGGGLSGRASPMQSGRVPVPRPTPTNSARGSARGSARSNSGGSPVIANVPRPSPKGGGKGKAADFRRNMSLSPDGAGSSMMLPRATLQKNKSFSSLDYGTATG